MDSQKVENTTETEAVVQPNSEQPIQKAEQQTSLQSEIKENEDVKVEEKTPLQQQNVDKSQIPSLKSSKVMEVEPDSQGLGKVLGEIKRMRKQAETEASLLDNRIHLMKMEEELSRKKFFQAKKQTLDMLTLKKFNEEKLAQKRKDIAMREYQLQQAQEEHEKDRLRRKKERREDQEEIAQSRRENYENIKRKQIENENFISAVESKSLERLQKQRMEIQFQEKQGQQSIIKFQTSKTEKYLGKYRFQITQEEREKDLTRWEISEMEKIEMEMIQRLKATQKLQKQAEEESKAIGGMSSIEFTNQFSPVLSKKQVKQLISKQLQNSSCGNMSSSNSQSNSNRNINNASPLVAPHSTSEKKSFTQSQVNLPSIDLKSKDFYNLSIQNNDSTVTTSSKTGRSYGYRSLQKKPKNLDDSLIIQKPADPYNQKGLFSSLRSDRHGHTEKGRHTDIIHRKKQITQSIEVHKDFVF